MRKKLHTRFPAARIKKIMQADEDVGKIALAVPVLVSKALELFLQDICDRTYEITLQRGAKTMNSVHLKHCVQSYNVFDFLRDIVSRVPDYGHGHGHSDAAGDDRIISRRRKPPGDECNDSDEELKRSKMLEMNHGSSSGRGRGRVRGRGRGRGARTTERETLHHETESEPCTSLQHNTNHNVNPAMVVDDAIESKVLFKESVSVPDESDPSVLKFDLNADVNENEEAKAAAIAAQATSVAEASSATQTSSAAQASSIAQASSVAPTSETKYEEYQGWSLSEVDKMAIDPLQLAQLSIRLDEDNEDYDEEG